MHTCRARIAICLTMTLLFGAQIAVPSSHGEPTLVRDCSSRASVDEADTNDTDSCSVIDDPNPYVSLESNPKSVAESARFKIAFIKVALGNWLRSRLVRELPRRRQDEAHIENDLRDRKLRVSH